MKEYFPSDEDPFDEIDPDTKRLVEDILSRATGLEGAEGYVQMDLSQIPQGQHRVRHSLSELAERLELAKQPAKKKRPSKRPGNQRHFSYPSGLRQV